MSDPHIGAVSLPSEGDESFPKDGQSCVMKGWGCTAQGKLV